MYNSGINLTLARSYSPVCVCFFLVLFTYLMLTFLHLSGVPAVPSYTIVASVLFVDNATRNHFIFNVDCIPFFVLVSMAINEGRARTAVPDIRKAAVGITLNVMWSVVSVLAVLRWETRFSVFRYVPMSNLWVFVFFICVHSFVYHPFETDFIIFLRVFDFTVLCIAWMYLFHVKKMSVKSVFDCTLCIIQFGSLLFTSPVVAFLQTVVMCVVFFFMSKTAAGCEGVFLSSTQDDLCEHDSDIEFSGGTLSGSQVSGLQTSSLQTSSLQTSSLHALGLEEGVGMCPSALKSQNRDDVIDFDCSVPVHMASHTASYMASVRQDTDSMRQDRVSHRASRATLVQSGCQHQDQARLQARLPVTENANDLGEIRKLFEEAKQRYSNRVSA